MSKNNDYNWQDDAACKGLPTEWFFPETKDHEMQSRGLDVCAGCPVKKDCYEYALPYEEFGTWGGVNQGKRLKARRVYFKNQRAERSVNHWDCGSEKGYQYLRRQAAKNGVTPIQCDPCRLAHNLYNVEYDALKK